MTSGLHSFTSDPLPTEICDHSAWYGPDLKRRIDWIARLSRHEITEVESAMRRLAESSLDLTTIGIDDFPLPTLGPRLRHLLDDVLGGRGFVLIRALPI